MQCGAHTVEDSYQHIKISQFFLPSVHGIVTYTVVVRPRVEYISSASIKRGLRLFLSILPVYAHHTAQIQKIYMH